MKLIVCMLILSSIFCLGVEDCNAQSKSAKDNDVNSFDLVGGKVLQIEADYNYDKFNFDYSQSRLDLNANAKLLALPSLTVSYGVSEKIEISYFSGISAVVTNGNITILLNQERKLITNKNIIGIGTSGFGFKLGAIREKGLRPSLNIENDLSMPFLGDPIFRPDNLGYNLSLNFHNTFSDLFDISYSAGNSWSGFDSSPYATQQYSFNPGFTFSDNLSANVNLFGYFNRKSSPLNKFSIGISYDFDDNNSVEITGGSAFEKTNKYYFLGLSGTFLIDFN